MIYKLEKVDVVINKIIRDLGLGASEIPVDDFIEWIADALQHIGAYAQFEEKWANIDIVSFEGDLPCDFYKLIEVKGCLNHNKSLQKEAKFCLSDKDYNINLNRIITAQETGFVEISYLAIPTDDDGYPLVPDDVSFRDAMFWKVAYHLSMRDPKCMPNQYMQDMAYCKNKWDFYCIQARTAANIGGLQAHKTFAADWTGLFNKPKLNNPRR